MSKRIPAYIRAYACALLESAGERSTLKAVYKSLEELDHVLSAYPPLLQSLNNKYLPLSNRDALAQDLGKRLKLHHSIINFFRLLIRNHHLHLYKAISARVKPSLERDQGIIRAAITSARPLSKEQIQSISRWVERRIPLKPDIAIDLDASLLGGVILEFGDHRLDASLRTQLHHFHMALKGSF